MGREIRRVPLDFDWPLNRIWKGFINPYYKKCPGDATGECFAGYSSAGKWLDAISRFIAMIGQAAVEEPHAAQLNPNIIRPHPYIKEWALAPLLPIPSAVIDRLDAIEDKSLRYRAYAEYLRDNPRKLVPFTEELVEFITKLAGRRPEFPFSGNLEYYIQKSLLSLAGIPEDSNWGSCKICGGDGTDPAYREAYDAWEPTPPPEGEGWQVWETVSEGSPISPVFPVKERLVDWLVEQGYSRQAAESFADGGWCCSMVVQNGKVYSDIEACALLKESQDGGRAEQ